jgi:hypothetical protein
MSGTFKKYVSAGMVLFFLLAGCEEDKIIGTGEKKFEIVETNIPEIININSNLKVSIFTRLTHPKDHAGIAVVNLMLSDNSGNDIKFEMFDDGSVEHPSGDVIAFDMVYSLFLSGNSLGLIEGLYTAQIEANSIEGEIIQSSQQNVKALHNKKPIIEAVSFPDSIKIGMLSTETSVAVSDSNGINDVRWIVLLGRDQEGDQIQFADTVFNRRDDSSVFIHLVDSSYAAGKKGFYFVDFIAEDLSGERSLPFSKPVFFQNTPPFIWDADTPDTLIVQQQNSVDALITVRVKDSQSLADVQEVYFNSYKPDGNPSSGNPFYMFDNGLPFDPNNSFAVGDQFKLDGVYSLTIFLSPGTSPGLYTFRFFVKDRAEQLTEGPVDSIRVVQ